MFLLAWAFMTTTAFLMVEVNAWFPTQVNFVSMAGHSLGRWGKGLSWILYLFLFYSLLVAYISGSGSLSSTYFQTAFDSFLLPWVGSLFFALIFGSVVYMGTRTVDHWNRILMFGKIAAFLGMVFLSAKYINPHLLARTEPSYIIMSLPVLIVSFGFHNMIPSLVTYLDNDIKRIRITILGGSLFTLAVYLIWEIVVLGIVPPDGKWGLLASWKEGKEASEAVAGILGVSWMSSFAQTLAFFALLTSFLAQTLGLVHFLSDGLKVPRQNREQPWVCALALLPPLILSLIYPQLFIKALNFAGGVCAVVLFGILPATMVWIGRYSKAMPAPYRVPGGKPLLIVVFAFALFILFFQISSMLGIQF